MELKCEVERITSDIVIDTMAKMAEYLNVGVRYVESVLREQKVITEQDLVDYIDG